MNRLPVENLILAIGLVFSQQSYAADICRAIALQDVAALESPTTVIKKGGFDESITQFLVNKITGATSFCSHGGVCYPTHVTVNGGSFEALRLTNCKIRAQGYSSTGDDSILYEVDPIRSKISVDQLRFNDISDRLAQLGLCLACADNMARFYTEKPKSRCATLTRSALEGNPDALQALQENPDYCVFK